MKKVLTKELERAVASVAHRIELRAIRPTELSARLFSEAPDSVGQMHFDIEYSATPAPLGDGFVVEGAFSLKASVKGDQGAPAAPPFLEVKYRVGVIYGLKGELPSSEVLTAFAETNGLVHLWPYFRVFVHESCGQMAVPVILVPPFRAIAYAADAETGAELTAAAPVARQD